MRTIDCRGLECPKPVIKTKKYFDSIGEGEATIIVDNEVAYNNVTKFAMAQGYQVEGILKEDEYEIVIEKRGCLEVLEEDKNIVVMISTELFGDGDEELGKILMKSYLYALSEAEKTPKTIMFVNSGVKLVTEDSEVLESLELLVSQRVEVLSCGTCLDFYGLKDKVKVGSITNMYDIVDKMNGSENFIKI